MGINISGITPRVSALAAVAVFRDDGKPKSDKSTNDATTPAANGTKPTAPPLPQQATAMAVPASSQQTAPAKTEQDKSRWDSFLDWWRSQEVQHYPK